MSKNILIINSSTDTNQLLVNLFAELKQKGCSFYLLSKSSGLYNQFKQNNWLVKKTCFGPNLDTKLGALGFIVLLPVLLLAYFMFMAYLAYSKKIKTVICLNWNEKIIIAPIAKILGLKNLWLELPGNENGIKSKLLQRFYKFNSKWAEIIAFTNFTKMRLKRMGLNEDNIKIIYPGIKLNQFKHQDNIFNKLAQPDQGNFRRKYFTIGTITNLNCQQNIETLFRAVKICLTVVPNLQLIIVGDGDERKNLSWLAKKMGIDGLVWFVGKPASPFTSLPDSPPASPRGESQGGPASPSPSQGGQKYLRKWLNGFDVFIAVSEKINFTDFDICLQAMSTGLPIIAPRNLGLEDVIQEDKTGFLIEGNNNEALARQIIKLQQNKHLRLRLGKEAQERVDKYFGIDNMVKQLEETIST